MAASLLFFMSYFMLASDSRSLRHDISLHMFSVLRQNLTSGKVYQFEKFDKDQ